jgi:streptogramin lyase
MGDRHRPIEPVTLNGARFDSLTLFSDLPYLMWPADEGQPVELKNDPETVRIWLAGCTRELGLAGFEPRFLESFQWRDNQVLSYELIRNGLVLYDARIMVHFEGEAFVGLQNHVDGRIVSIEDPDPLAYTPGGLEPCYYLLRLDVGEYRAVPAAIERLTLADRSVITVRGEAGEYERTVRPDPAAPGEGAQSATFKEYVVPVGSFPDQISVAEDLTVWFSQPLNDLITSFDPVREVFTQYSTRSSGGSGPDGLIVGTQGRVWSGMYYSGSLGYLDANTKVVYNYLSPYRPAAMAIPVETTDGSVWVTDHAYNKISEFDPSSGTWLQTVTMPTPNCWVVQGHEDADRGYLYFTEYNANQLGKIALGGSTVRDIRVPGGGPAFCVYSRGKVYYSRWNEAGMGVYDVEADKVTQYSFPVANEWGGPMWLRPSGDIVFGTRNRGYIMIFHVATETFTALEIPTRNPGLKDGLTVGPDDVIWFTESGANKIARLDFNLPCPEDCTGDRRIDQSDLALLLSCFQAGDCCDINGDGTTDQADLAGLLARYGQSCP